MCERLGAICLAPTSSRVPPDSVGVRRRCAVALGSTFSATATGYPKYPEQGLKALVRGSQRALMTTVTCLTQTLEVTVALNIYYPQYAGHVACT